MKHSPISKVGNVETPAIHTNFSDCYRPKRRDAPRYSPNFRLYRKIWGVQRSQNPRILLLQE